VTHGAHSLIFDLSAVKFAVFRTYLATESFMVWSTQIAKIAWKKI